MTEQNNKATLETVSVFVPIEEKGYGIALNWVVLKNGVKQWEFASLSKAISYFKEQRTMEKFNKLIESETTQTIKEFENGD